MTKNSEGRRPAISITMAGLLLALAVVVAVAACAPAAAPAPTAAPAAKPAAAAAKPAAAAPTAAPAAAKPAAAAPTAAPAAAKPAGPATLIRVGASDPEGTTAPALTIGKFAELATQKSNGELDVRAFYTSLGVEQQLAEAVKSGSVDAGMTATPNIARFSEAFIRFDLPFLFKDDKGYIDVLKNHAAGKEALAQFEKDMGVKALVIMSHTYDASPNGADIQTRDKQLKVPADIQGLKIRAMSTPVNQAVLKAWGANPTPVDYSQVYSAVQQGVVDGTSGTPMPPYASIKLFEVTKYYLAIGFQNNLLPLYINQKKFDSLTPSQQKAILEAAAEAETFGGQYARDMVKKATELTEEAGTVIYRPEGDELAQWLSVREAVWQEVAGGMAGKIDLNVANSIYESEFGGSKR